MPRATKYNTLGQILTAGGDISLGVMIARGAKQSDLLATIATRYPNLPPSDITKLMAVAEAGAAAGVKLNQLQPNDELNIAELPINPSLFGDDVQGRRYTLVADVTNAQTGRTITMRLDETLDKRMDQILEEFDQNMREWINTSPKLIERIGQLTEQGNTYANVLFAQARY